MKSKSILIIALIMACITTFLFMKFLTGLENKYKGEQKRITIVVPKADIKKNQMVTVENFELKEFIAEAVHPEAVAKIEDVVGNYALIDMKAGEVLFATRFSNMLQESELITRKIKEGYRAIAIGVNYEESVATLIQPEDYVDVISTTPDDANDKKLHTTTLFHNVRVLAVGKRIVEKDKNTSTDKTVEEEDEYSCVTVELKPEDIMKIVNADESGNIKFVLISKITP
ncbi:MAG: Flp pilus assembly protein CpaB [Clostridium sp.]